MVVTRTIVVCHFCNKEVAKKPAEAKRAYKHFCGNECVAKWRDNKSTNFEPRFWSKVDKTPGLGPNGDCWEWTRHRTEGYGSFEIKGIQYRSHRIAYSLGNGIKIQDLTKEQLVCHTCDNPPCCNPKHLFLGTNLDNVSDMVTKGRHNKGASVNTAKLTEDEVISILKSYYYGDSPREIHSNYGLKTNLKSVERICRGIYWKHIDREAIKLSIFTQSKKLG